MKLFRKLHSQRAPAGLERQILGLLPKIFIAGTLIPLAVAVGRRVFPPQGSQAEVDKAIATADIVAFATAATVWTAVLTVAVGCIVVIIMKGPAYVADRYELEDADRPAPDRRGDQR